MEIRNQPMTNDTSALDKSQLTIIDMQAKLSTIMPASDMQIVVNNCVRLVQAANLLAVPITVTEQYPQGLGATLTDIMQHLDKVKPIAKTVFSAYREPAFKAKLQRDKPQIILVGLEAHICVLQTALDLMMQGKKVFVVEDAVISRNTANKANAIARMASAGCIITNTESVMFEWLGHAQHEAFKSIAQLIK